MTEPTQEQQSTTTPFSFNSSDMDAFGQFMQNLLGGGNQRRATFSTETKEKEPESDNSEEESNEEEEDDDDEDEEDEWNAFRDLLTAHNHVCEAFLAMVQRKYEN